MSHFRYANNQLSLLKKYFGKQGFKPYIIINFPIHILKTDSDSRINEKLNPNIYRK